MRTNIILFLFVFMFQFFNVLNTSYVQDGENPLPYVQPEPKFDTAPRYPGGNDALMQFFRDNIIYTESEKAKNKQGDVSVKFDITIKGVVTNIYILNGVPGAPGYAKEAERILKMMPHWIPANKNKKPVCAEVLLSIPFKP